MRECMNCGGDVNADGGCWCAQVAYWQARAGEWGEQGDKLRAENAQLRVAVVEWSESYHDLCTKDVCGKLLKDISDRHEASKARLQEIAQVVNLMGKPVADLIDRNAVLEEAAEIVHDEFDGVYPTVEAAIRAAKQ